MSTSKSEVAAFQQTVWNYYDQHGRDLPWRKPSNYGDFDPYHIMVSEVMLQQTQVSRVIPKYLAFIKSFPDITALASAELEEVLRHWSGLGYNRRAKFLWQAAREAVEQYNGQLPHTVEELDALPGIGINTAAAIAAYSYNLPVVFIETNIRSVYIHHFFEHTSDVSDKELLPLIEQSLDTQNPREWYWALMDYGSHLKSVLPNPSRKSKHHTKQSSFEGSLRQLRGQVLKKLLHGTATYDEIASQLLDDRLDHVLADLEKESMIHQSDGTYSLGK